MLVAVCLNANAAIYQATQLNTYMKQFRATVKVGGMWMNTIVFADNPNHAFQLAKSQYGTSNVLAPPTQLGH